MKLELGYGKTVQTVEIPDQNLIDVLLPNPEKGAGSEDALLKTALDSPIGTEKLISIVRPGEKVAIVTSDITRPMPSHKVLPVVLEELYAAGIKPEDITVVFALGSHRTHSEAEMRQLVGDKVFEAVTCVDGDSGDCVHMGYTRTGTPVDITRAVAEADRRILLGNIEYHYFAGYSGGAKALMPGVSTREAIQQNHRFMVHPKACVGNLEQNPVRDDLEEALEHCPVDFILNVVLDEQKRVIHAVAGHPILAHREGCRFLDGIYGKEIETKADIVIASQGGAPKDINLYQTQKALDNASHAVKDGGIVILVGACGEGLGERVFEEWIQAAKKPKELVERIGHDFQLGGHKAAAIALVLQSAEIWLVSDMDPELVESCFLKPYNTVQAALDDALAKLGADATVLAMPYGGSTLPHLK